LALINLIQGSTESPLSFLVVFLEDGPMRAQLRALGAETAVIRAGRLRHPHRIAASVARIALLARAWRADLMFGWMTKANLYASPAAKLAGLPALWYQHGFPSSRNWMDRLATALPAQGILACSSHVGEAQAGLCPRRPIRVVYPGIDLERFDPRALPTPAEARARLRLPLEGPLIGIVGRLQRWKGIHVLIEAMPSVVGQHPSAHCFVVGGPHALEPDYRNELIRLIEALGLQDHILLAGHQRDVDVWMQAADVIVHASDNEPFGMVIIEAMAIGKPVIATASAGPKEIITDGVDGLLFPIADPNSLTTALMRCLADKELRERIAQKARATSERFSVGAYSDSFSHAIGELAG
jgi:glycosyltransferase involved in cell wall biosynthesis